MVSVDLWDYLYDVVPDVVSYPDGFQFYWNDEIEAVDGAHVFSGYDFRKAVDPRWVLDHQTADNGEENHPVFVSQLLRDAGDDILLTSYPEYDYDHYKNTENFPIEKVDVKTLATMNEEANKYADLFKKGKGRRRTAFRFRSRPEVRSPKLSVREIYKNPKFDDDTTLELKYYPIANGHEKIPVPVVVWYAQWTVVVHDGDIVGQERKRGKVETKQELTAAGKQAQEGLGIYSMRPDTTMSGP